MVATRGIGGWEICNLVLVRCIMLLVGVPIVAVGRSPCNILQSIYEIGELQMTEELW